MDILHRDDLKSLLTVSGDPCITIYQPVLKTVPDNQQNPVRLKNLVRSAEEKLIAHGMDEKDAEAFVKPLRSLIDNDDFWAHPGDGLAIFLAKDFLKTYMLPMKFQEMVYVETLFHIKPLLTLFNTDGRFYLLAVSQNDNAFFVGTQFGLEPIQVPNMPTSLADALKYDETEDLEAKGHLGGQRKVGGGQSLYHGQQGTSTQGGTKEQLARYFQAIDKSLHEILRDEKAPLIVAAVEYYFPIYREANNYKHLLDEGVMGNPNAWSRQELHEKAWAVGQQHFAQEQKKAQGIYRHFAAESKTSNDLKDILMSAEFGRVEYLFVPIGIERWGRYDTTSKEVDLHDGPIDGDVDLLELAARQTIMNNGTVFAVQPDQLPDSAPIAAVYRY